MAKPVLEHSDQVEAYNLVSSAAIYFIFHLYDNPIFIRGKMDDTTGENSGSTEHE